MAENNGRDAQPETNVSEKDADGSEPSQSEGATLPAKCPATQTETGSDPEESLTHGKAEDQGENATGTNIISKLLPTDLTT